VLFVGALCAAVAAALGRGARFEPDDMATATVGLLVAAGFTMSRDAGHSTPVVIVAAVVGVVGFVVALGPERARRIVELRTATLAALAAEGIALEPIDPHVPAGGVIIDALLASWIPEVVRDAI
jgi:hypothetical protein